MADFFFISYSSVDGKDFALKLANELAAGPPSIPVWLDERDLRPGEDWRCTGRGSDQDVQGNDFRDDDGQRDAQTRSAATSGYEPSSTRSQSSPSSGSAMPNCRSVSTLVNTSTLAAAFDARVARLRKYLARMDSPEGQLQALKYRFSDAQRELPRAERAQQARIRDDMAGVGATDRSAAKGHRQPRRQRSSGSSRVSRSVWRANASLPSRSAGFPLASSFTRLR